jgi:hypothetical protein
MAEGNKRPPSRRSRWIWTGVLAVPVIAIAVATIVLAQQPLGRPPTSAPTEALTDGGFTDFSEVGIEYAAAKRFVSVNATKLPIPASAVGLMGSETATVPASDLGNRLQVTAGSIVVDVSSAGDVSVTTSGYNVTQLQYSLGGLGIAEIRNILLEDVADYEISSDEIGPLVATVKSHQRDGEAYSGTLMPGDRLGFAVTPSIDCDAAGSCSITHTLDLTGR